MRLCVVFELLCVVCLFVLLFSCVWLPDLPCDGGLFVCLCVRCEVCGCLMFNMRLCVFCEVCLFPV